MLISGNGRITLDNTLDERLRLLEDRVRLPCPIMSRVPFANCSLLPPSARLLWYNTSLQPTDAPRDPLRSLRCEP